MKHLLHIRLFTLLFALSFCATNSFGQSDPACNPAGSASIRPGQVFFNYGSGIDVRNSSRRTDMLVGQMLVGPVTTPANDMAFGAFGQILIPPFSPIVTATQGDLLDRIQISWVLNPLGPNPTQGFNLYRDGVFLATVASNIRNYNDFNVIAGRPYNYEVRGINVYGEGPSGYALGFQVPNGVVTGQVQTVNGSPVPDALVTLTPMQGFSLKLDAADGAFFYDTVSILPAANGEWTLSFWMKTDSATVNAGVLDLNPFPLFFRSIASAGGNKGIQIAQTAAGTTLLSAPIPDSTKNEWHHIALSVDTDGKGRLYLDGTLVSIGTLPPVPSATEVRFGARTGQSGWAGRLDEFRIYHRRLEEIDLADVIAGTASSLTPGLKYYWKLDEEQGTKSFDLIQRTKLYFCGGAFDTDRPPVSTSGLTNEEGFYRIESVSYSTGTTFLARPSKDFYMYRALRFVRSQSDYATLPDFSLTPKATIELWLNSAGPDGEQCVLSKKWGANDFRLLLTPGTSTDTLKFYLNGQIKSFGPLGMGYQHLAFTIDSAGTNRTVTAYKNGVSIGSHTFTSVNGNWSDTSQVWMLGARPSTPNPTDHYGGLIDELAVYDTTLSAAAIAGHFTAPRDMQERGLRVYFALNEGSGNRLNNSGSVLMSFGTANGTDWTPFAPRQATEPHVFSPVTRQVTLNPSITSVDQVDFTDRSTVPVTGYVRYKNTDCFAQNVEIFVNGASYSPKIFTDSTGKFLIDFNPGDNAILEPKFEGYSFAPASWAVTNVTSPISGIVFNITNTRTVKGTVAGGSKPSCKKSIIKAPAGTGTGTICIVKVRSADGCFERPLIIDNQEGVYEFNDLPPLESLTVAVVEHSDADVKAAFQVQGGATVNLTKRDTILDFTYSAPPEIDIVAGLDSSATCPAIILVKDDVATVDLKLKEQYVPIVDNMNVVVDDGICYLDTADFRIINFIGEQVFDTVMSNGLLRYRFRVANPNPSPPYLKSIQFVATSVTGRTSSIVREVVITGIRSKETTFSTLLPETPSVILRDPPGDGSYAYLEQSSKVCKSYVVVADYEVGGGVGFEVHLGGNVEIVTAPLGVGTINNTGWIFDTGFELDVTYQKISDSTFQTCTTTNQRLSTSDNDLVVGAQGGDIYFGEAINIIFGFADMVNFNDTTCTASVKTILNVEPGDFSTVFAYSEWYINGWLIPYLDSLILNPNNTPEDSARYVESKERWINILNYNSELKGQAKLVRNVSFDGGIELEYSETSDTSLVTSIEDLINSEENLTTHLGYEFNKAGIVGTVKILGATSNSTKDEDGTEQSLTTGYVLKDDDIGDAFTVDIGMDSVYKTPVFNTRAGQSSCPWEPATAHREGNSLIFRDGSGALATDVPANEPAVFKFYFGNTSATNETWTYAFTAGPESNPHGAKISINGSPMDAPIMYAIPWGTSIPVTVTLERGPVEYEYDSLEVVLYSLCEDIRANELGILPDDDTILYSAQYISAHFIRPCSEVDVNVPEQNWVVLNNDPIQPGTIRRITVSGYDLNNTDFQLIRVQYRRTDGDGAWINIPGPGGAAERYNPNWFGFSALPDPKPPTLDNDFTQYFWETAGLADGLYEVHAWAVCTGASTDKPGFSEIIKGRIDREPPSIVGVPQPSDGVYQVGDEVSFTFNQHVDCNKLNPITDVTLVDEVTGQPIDISITCFENKIVLDPTFANQFYENRLLRAELKGIEDLVGNVFNGTSINKGIWRFYVDRNELAWLTDSLGMTKFEDENKTAVANIHNRGGYPVPFKIMNVPDWVHVSPDQGTLAANEIRPISFTVDSSLAFGNWADSIILHTETGANPFFMGGDEGLPIGVRVVCRPPFANVNPALFENTMSMVLQVNIEGNFSTDPEDIVAAYINDELRGRTNVQYVPLLNKYLAYLTIFGDPDDLLDPIRLEVWDASECQRYGFVQENFTFQPDNVIGTPNVPQVIHTGGLLLREVPFNYGWNWISFNLAFPNSSLDSALATLHHPDNDLIRSQGPFSLYSGGSWVGALANLNNTSMYIYRADQSDTLRMLGTPLDPALTPIPLVTGWNWIGYVPNYSLPIDDALATVPAAPGDIIKSQVAFAQYSEVVDGPNTYYRWIGNLKYMTPPNGYQIKLSNAGTLTYPPPPAPLTENPAQARDESGMARLNYWTVDPTQFEYSSTLIGMLRANGLNATTDDMELGVFVGNQVRGSAQAIYIQPLDAYLFFLTMYANIAGELLTFKLYDNSNQQVQNLVQTMFFSPNQHQGSIENPVPFDLPSSSTGEETVPAIAFDAFPNPFSSETALRFFLPKSTDVTLTIADARGREILRREVSAQSGTNTVIWNGRSGAGEWLSSGVYTVRLQTQTGSVTQKVVVQRLP